MSWKSSVRGSTTIACYMDRNLNGKKVKVSGYSPSLNDLGPAHLFIPEGHTGTLTGLVELASFAQELPPDTRAPIECMVLVEICWDDIDHWHDGFCNHSRKTYRYSCLIDIFMSSYKMPPNFLFLADSTCHKMHCIEKQLWKHPSIISIIQDQPNQESPRMTWVKYTV